MKNEPATITPVVRRGDGPGAEISRPISIVNASTVNGSMLIA